ncbi:MAG: LamG-like jellyroll fold domain-containing protein, partial [Verrucomicrobiota bacterium]
MRIFLSFCVAWLLSLPGVAGIVSFTATPASFLPGQEVTLSWSVTNGDIIAINQGVQAISGATGSVTVIPTAATTYTLTNSTSNTSAQANVTPFVLPQLTHRWSFNEGSGTAVIDSIGTAHGVLLGNGATRSATQITLPGGSSASAPYIDLPNGLISSLNQLTIEGWMTISGSQNWSRIFDFGTGTAGEVLAPGGAPTGTEYLLLTGQIGGDQNTKRLALRDNNVEQSADLNNPVTNGQQFHFAVVYDATGNNGSPQIRYYRDGTQVGVLNTTYRLQNITDVNNWLGRSQFSSDANLQGAYNEFRIWNGPLGTGYLNDATATPETLPLDSFTAFPALTVYRGSPVRLSYLLGNPSNGTLSASIDQGVGALTGASGFVTVTPPVTTTYKLTVDNGGVQRTSSVTITVIPGDPVAESLNIDALYQSATPVTLVATDPNTPANQLTYTVMVPPGHGTLSGTGANLTYTPAAGYFGPDSFAYQVNDGFADSNTASVIINVLPPPTPPTDILLSGSAFFTDYKNGSFAGRLRATDVNTGDRFTFALID